MSLEYFYKLNDSEFSMYCPDSAIMESLTESCPDEMNDIFGVSIELDGETPTAEIESDQLVNSIDSLLKEIRINKEIVPYTYILEMYDPILGKLETVATGYHTIPRDIHHYYSVTAYSCNKCYILKNVKLADGEVGELIEKKDIGDIKRIEMESINGPFTLNIKKRRGKFPLTADLKKLKKFFEENGPGTVKKVFVG